ncbi:MAG TPA: hypothetical protein VJK51_05520 [Candidatus Nanoarchaeia archaeon]|nr:hypothetical protein [Candidatus Nanoarchaeia archaeon]
MKRGFVLIVLSAVLLLGVVSALWPFTGFPVSDPVVPVLYGKSNFECKDGTGYRMIGCKSEADWRVIAVDTCHSKCNKKDPADCGISTIAKGKGAINRGKDVVFGSVCDLERGALFKEVGYKCQGQTRANSVFIGDLYADGSVEGLTKSAWRNVVFDKCKTECTAAKLSGKKSVVCGGKTISVSDKVPRRRGVPPAPFSCTFGLSSSISPASGATVSSLDAAKLMFTTSCLGVGKEAAKTVKYKLVTSAASANPVLDSENAFPAANPLSATITIPADTVLADGTYQWVWRVCRAGTTACSEEASREFVYDATPAGSCTAVDSCVPVQTSVSGITGCTQAEIDANKCLKDLSCSVAGVSTQVYTVCPNGCENGACRAASVPVARLGCTLELRSPSPAVVSSRPAAQLTFTTLCPTVPDSVRRKYQYGLVDVTDNNRVVYGYHFIDFTSAAFRVVPDTVSLEPNHQYKWRIRVCLSSDSNRCDTEGTLWTEWTFTYNPSG